MKRLLLRLEPIIWLLFGQGILIGTMLLTAWIAVVGILAPLGITAPLALGYDRAHRLATARILGLPVGQGILFAILALPLWKGAHHLRSLAIDLLSSDRDPAIASALYAAAALGTFLALIAVIRL